MELSIIAAIDEERGIGKSGRLPWRLSGDLKRFKKITTSGGSPNAVIMGHGTWDSLSPRFRPLPGRFNIVLSRRSDFRPEGAADTVEVAHSFAAALRLASGHPKAFAIGGARVFEEALKRPECQRVYLTRVAGSFHCDAFFPELPSDFVRTERSNVQEEDGVQYHFETHERSG